MGTINYKTSDFITLGYNCDNIEYNEEYYEYYKDIIQDYFDQNVAIREMRETVKNTPTFNHYERGK